MPKVNTSFTSIIPKGIKNVALVEYLERRFSYHPKDIWVERIQNGLVLINQSLATTDTLINNGDELVYLIKDFEEPDVPRNCFEVFQNDQFAVIAKPAPLPMQRTSRILTSSFVQQVRDKWGEKYYPIHRIDAETSGMVVFAKNHETAKQAQNHLDQFLIEKFYLAIVEGDFNCEGIYEASFAEQKGSAIRNQMHYDPEGKTCKTEFWKISSNENSSLVLAKLHTGRKHQIRASLSQLNHPIVGDKIYNHGGQYYLKQINDELTAQDFETLKSEHHLLHSFALKTNFSKGQFIVCQPFSESFLSHLKRFPNWEKQIAQTGLLT